jgi:multiple sugar transport system permease protein
MGEWGSFMDPLIYITTYKKQMVGVGLALFRGMTYSQWNLMMAGAAIQVIPVLVVFFAAQQYIIRGIVMTGLAGR